MNMNYLHLTLGILLALVPLSTSISCYYCAGCSASATLSSDGVTSYTLCGTYYSNGLWYRGGSSTSLSCSILTAVYTAAGATNTNCCTTDLCNSAAT
ncbi:unnamed protein product, partial [Rotaria socialis]